MQSSCLPFTYKRIPPLPPPDLKKKGPKLLPKSTCCFQDLIVVSPYMNVSPIGCGLSFVYNMLISPTKIKQTKIINQTNFHFTLTFLIKLPPLLSCSQPNSVKVGVCPLLVLPLHGLFRWLPSHPPGGSDTISLLMVKIQ